jgi:hypothetical protein
MKKKIFGALVVAMLSLLLPVCVSAQQLASLNALAKGKGTMIANGMDKFKLTAVLVILKENGDAQITLYSDIQFFAQGRWSSSKDPNVRGKLILREDGQVDR